MHRPALRGMTLIEQMVTIAVLAIMLAIGVPSFSDWIRNTRLRGMAESLRSDLQMARAEAIRRNTTTRLQLVNSLDNSCALNASGPAWVANIGAAQNPEGSCNAEIDAAPTQLLRKSPPAAGNANDLRLAATVCDSSTARTALGFDPLGRQAALTAPTSPPACIAIAFSSASGTCVASGGNVRCLQVRVSVGGDSRICDPSRTANSDPMRC